MSEYEPKSVCPPSEENMKKPFFAYGIFKPGQIAFSKIEDYKWRYEPHDIDRKMLIRDGVPVIEGEDSHYNTKGFKIYFNKGDCETAYKIISETEPFRLYEWDVKEVDGEECNILIGKDMDKGTHESADDSDRYVDDFNGRKDPYFDGLIEFISKEFKPKEYSQEDKFYKLQMLYMILWSAIDRYCSLKYGDYHDQWELRSKLANDKVFRDSFKKCWDEKKIKPKRSVYSNKLNEYIFKKNPWFAINYYYTIRCNVVHRGKDRRTEESILCQSLNELLCIFKGVIDNTFQDL